MEKGIFVLFEISGEHCTRLKGHIKNVAMVIDRTFCEGGRGAVARIG